jgi:uncharacterized protein (DUF58 family)
MVRQFETETERPLRLVVDATASMGYRGTKALGAKFAWAALVAAALARIALANGDPVGLTFLGGAAGGGAAGGAVSLRAAGGREQFERVVATLEAVEAGGDAVVDAGVVDRALDGLVRTARRGTVFVMLSDLLDLPEGTERRLAALLGRGREVVVVQVLDPDEVEFTFDGAVRFRAMEGQFVVESDGPATRAVYLEALAAHRAGWNDVVTGRGGRLLTGRTDEDPIGAVRGVIEALR